MNKFISAIGSTLLVLVITALLAVFDGTLIWLLWPVTIPAVFPGLVLAGTIAAKLTWWQAVCFSWIMGLLFSKSSSSTTKKE